MDLWQWHKMWIEKEAGCWKTARWTWPGNVLWQQRCPKIFFPVWEADSDYSPLPSSQTGQWGWSTSSLEEVHLLWDLRQLSSSVGQQQSSGRPLTAVHAKRMTKVYANWDKIILIWVPISDFSPITTDNQWHNCQRNWYSPGQSPKELALVSYMILLWPSEFPCKLMILSQLHSIPLSPYVVTGKIKTYQLQSENWERKRKEKCRIHFTS